MTDKILLRCERGGYAVVNRSEHDANVLIEFPDDTAWEMDVLPAGARVFFKAPDGTVKATAAFANGASDVVRKDCSAWVPPTTTTTEPPPTTTLPPPLVPRPTLYTTVVGQPEPYSEPELAYTGDGTQALAAVGIVLCFLGGLIIGLLRGERK